MCLNVAVWTPVVVLPTVRTNESGEFVKQDKPTLLLMVGVCCEHRNHYVLSDWISSEDWKEMKRIAESNGFSFPDRELITITFRPLDWNPNMKWMEIER
jgi:hypothetical protein